MNLASAFSAVSDVSVKIVILAVVLALFPKSPFTQYIFLAQDIPYLQYLNWFLPIDDIILVLESWLLVISTYYSIMFASRFVGIVKG